MWRNPIGDWAILTWYIQSPTYLSSIAFLVSIRHHQKPEESRSGQDHPFRKEQQACKKHQTHFGSVKGTFRLLRSPGQGVAELADSFCIGEGQRKRRSGCLFIVECDILIKKTESVIARPHLSLFVSVI